MGSGFFPDPSEEDDLELRSAPFWTALLDRIREDGFPRVPRRVLDIGCHRGGLLALVAAHWRPEELIGIEPLESARARARLRLRTLTRNVRLLHPEQWPMVGDSAIDLVVCHEVLYLLPSLDSFAEQVARVLDVSGRAYVATGCHTENPVWPAWKAQLSAMGHRVYDHEPMAIMSAAARQGLVPSVRPLRDAGWATHDPTRGGFTFPSVGALLDHQFRHKLLFRFARS